MKKPVTFFQFLVYLYIGVLIICSYTYPAILWGKGKGSNISLEGFFLAHSIIYISFIILFIYELNKSNADVYKYSCYGSLILEPIKLEALEKVFASNDMVECLYSKYNNIESLNMKLNADKLLNVSNKKLTISIEKIENELILNYELQSYIRLGLNSSLHRYVHEALTSNNIKFKEHIYCDESAK
ncbi:hypothetical protein DAY19_14315 [Halobacteriovorax vibrionivorans]|uniref:Uncharacterized protein n=1 Tax=Halobacteriovorax vibrionivorans TaxID=2152716 RepID=A0ABY0IDV9_9BACT|nr:MULTISPECIES: hypothetical protein [Halobacteriovorax]RZF21148.1 hypothetical protein DAY19_14315 [Halobacteriovorax vibrionivorans]TGD46255.1 hypothetical protein EP118_12700 [Halobacteriovorax sp. Y22]